jgi:hypothetical protein
MESVHPPAVHNPIEQRSAVLADPSSEEVLKEAGKLLVQILSILDSPVCETSSSARSFRMARAHALTLLDHLARIQS